MLNKRQLRIKVLQTLYAYYQSGASDQSVSSGTRSRTKANVALSEAALLENVNQVRAGYIAYLALLIDIGQHATTDAKERKAKFRPSAQDLVASDRLAHNPLLRLLAEDKQLQADVLCFNINWAANQPNLARELFAQLKMQAAYQSYCESTNKSVTFEVAIVKHLFKAVLCASKHLNELMEAKYINWLSDEVLVKSLVLRTIKHYSKANPCFPSLFADESADQEFIKELHCFTIENEVYYTELIAAAVLHWKVSRIALMDILMIKMALTEFIKMKAIPLKVTVNEYVEISKRYSTPESYKFINGMLDKILAKLPEEKILKSGPGLITTSQKATNQL